MNELTTIPLTPEKVRSTEEKAPSPVINPPAKILPVAIPIAAVAPQKNGADPAENANFTARKSSLKKLLIGVAILAVFIAAGIYAWVKLHKTGPGDSFASGNGRIEATEINVAAKLGGRVDSIRFDEGDFVKAGEQVAQMQVTVLDAQRDQARAQHQQAITGVSAAEAQVAGRDSDKVAAQALVTQRESELSAAEQHLARSKKLSDQGISTVQELDDDRATERSAQAAVNAAKAQVNAAQAAIDAAAAQVLNARASVTAAAASIATIEADITDSQLVSPRAGRVQYRVAQPGEVLAAGGVVLNIVDLNDVYMTFFLPAAAAGKIALGSDVRLVLDAAPDYVIPAKVSFVASTAQFTPKTVETASERQKLMFRVRARIDADVLQKNIKLVKTGLPGVAWLKLDAKSEWPKELVVKVPQ
jgi:HlyD family secretion protein